MARTSGSRSSTEPPGVLVGRISGAHGLRGQLRVRCFSDGEDALLQATRVTLAAEGAAVATPYEVTSVAPGRSGELRLTLDGVEDRDAAEALRGRLMRVDTAELEALPEGEYYGYELLGCRLEAEDGSPVGRVRDIWETGAADVLVVDGEDGREHLVPANLLREVDVEGRRGVIEVLPGLLDEVSDEPADEDGAR